MFKKAHELLEDFKDFAVKGNALELAIAVVIGGAFGKIVSSLVSDIITPTIALVTGGADFEDLSLVLREAQGDAPAVMLTYGIFLQSVFDFLIIAASIFLAIRLISNARKRLVAKEDKDVPEHKKPAEERLLEEIRDLLRRSVEDGSRRAD